MRPVLLQKKWKDANYSTTSSKGQERDIKENKVTRIAVLSATEGCLYTSLHNYPQETQFRIAQSGACPPHHRLRGDRLHPGDRSQLAGTLCSLSSRGQGEGPARCALSHSAGDIGHSCGKESHPKPFEIRGETTKTLGRGSMATPGHRGG